MGSSQGPVKLGSMSQLVKVVNDHSEKHGVEVQVKKKMCDGNYIPAEEADYAAADFDIKLGQILKRVSAMGREEKLAYSRQMRDAGNERFHAREYIPALEMYAQAMAGFDGDKERLSETRHEIALPIMANMAVCMLELHRPRQALELCDEALAIEPECTKALVRRGKALVALDRYAEAKEVFEAARGSCDDAADAAYVARQLRRLGETTRRVSRVTAAQRRNLRAAFGQVYADKPERDEILRRRREKMREIRKEAIGLAVQRHPIIGWLRAPGTVADTNAGDVLLALLALGVAISSFFAPTLATSMVDSIDATLHTPWKV